MRSSLTRRLRLGLVTGAVLGLLSVGLQPVATAATGPSAADTAAAQCQRGLAASDPARPAFDPSPARQSLARLLGAHANQFELRPAAKTGTGDCFTVTGGAGHIVITGTSGGTLLTGANYYLKHAVNAGITWNGDDLNHLPKVLPAPAGAGNENTPFANRFANNDTMPGYSGPYWTFGEWQHEIDVLAANGVNEMMDYPGAAILYDLVFQHFGYTDTELRAWIPEPAHQPWWLMQNMSTFDEPISSQLLSSQATLGRQIADQLRGLGMQPVLPGYFGTVPPQFTQHDPGADVVPQGTWAGFPRPDWLSPLDPRFGQIAADFYRLQRQIFGPASMFEMNPLQEGGQTGNIPLGPAAKAIQDALEKANPNAIWTTLGWQSNPQPAVLAAIDTSKVLILDGLSDTSTTLNRDSDWKGTPYVFGTIWGYGGHSAIGGNLTDWTTEFPKWASRPNTALSGIALMPEANDNNPVGLSLFTDLAWHPDGIDPNTWITQYADWRYGGTDPHASAAWQDLLATAYSTPPDGAIGQNQTPFGLQPDLSLGSSQRYDMSAFARALPQLLAVNPRLRDSSAYRYDMVDVARQVLDNDSMLLLPQIRSAYQDGDRSRFESLSTHWLDLMSLQDRLLGTDQDFLFGPWVDDARKAASSPAEAAQLEYDARTIVGEWGTGTAEQVLHDYADRDRQGLMEFYRSRWQTYLGTLDTAMRTGQPPSAINWAAIDDAWAHQQNTYPSTPSGDSYQLASQVWQTVSTDPAFGAVTATTAPATVSGGQTSTVTVGYTNQNPVNAASGLSMALGAPSGFTVTATGPTTFASVPVGAHVSATFTVTVPAGYHAGSAMDRLPLTATARFGYGGAQLSNTTQTPLLVPSPVSSAYHTASFTTNAFGQSGNTFAIYSAGADMWLGTNEFGTIYSPGALVSGDTVQTEVTAQDDTGPWARTGIVVRNSLAAKGSAGYLDLAVTPSNGCALSSDTNGDGQLDTVVNAGGFTAPVYLKLVRDGTGYTGYCSADGKTWQTVGTATVPSAAANQDVGLFATAADGGNGAAGVARLTGFTITPAA
jgi:alpha-N-acetylglucosaminidase